MDVKELMAKAMYDDWKSRERVVQEEWDNTSPGIRKVFLRKAEAAYTAIDEAGLLDGWLE